MRRVLVNESFRTQRVTGQQRYAAEIVGRLDARAGGTDGIGVVAPPAGFWSSSTLRVWAWVQLVLPLRARRATLLSLTARAPLWRRRHVLVVHDLFVLSNPEWYSRRYIWTHAPLLRSQIRSARTVVAVSRPVADQLEALRSEPVPVAPNAPSEVFRATGADETSVLRARGLEPDGYLLSVGSRDPRKNLPRLADAYGALSTEERRRFPLVVVGGGASIYRTENIDWPEGTVDAGYVDDDELRALYRYARSVVFVPLSEGFGLPLVEAAAAGARGLLISEIDVFRWICGDDARYVDPRSTDAITAGLRHEIERPQDLELNLDRFDWDTSASVVADACRRAVDA